MHWYFEIKLVYFYDACTLFLRFLPPITIDITVIIACSSVIQILMPIAISVVEDHRLRPMYEREPRVKTIIAV